MKIAFFTLGCKVNQFESEVLAEQFQKEGFILSSFDDICDVYVVNTCMVTATSEKKSRQVIRKAKHQNPNALLIVCGCYAQIKYKELEKLPEIDIITGTTDRLQIISLVKKALHARQKIISVSDVYEHREMEILKATTFFDRTRANIKIEDGCENFCSYCIIPYTRGPIRSMPFDDVLSQVSLLIEKGYREIVLTGIQISAYGREFGKTLLDLLLAIEKTEGNFRIRLGSLNPFIFTDEFILEIASCQKLCPHFHISLQSGSDNILVKMNRKYNTQLYRRVISKIQKAIPNAAITTDIIAGFPGETEEDVTQTLALIQTTDFLHCHVFPYSRRPGTKADQLSGQIDKKTKEERTRRIRQEAFFSKQRFLQKFQDQCFEVLFETKNQEGYFQGFTPNYIPVYIKSDQPLKNTLLNVRLTKRMHDGFEGEMI